MGKTWIMKEFGRQEYQNIVYINFDSNARVAELFSADLDTQRILRGIEIYAGKKIDPENTLIIFDEVQEVPKALSSLKYFCEDTPESILFAPDRCWGSLCMTGHLFP